MALVEINNFDNHIYAVWFFCLKFCYKIMAFFMSINLYLSYFAQSWTVMSVSQTETCIDDKQGTSGELRKTFVVPVCW